MGMKFNWQYDSSMDALMNKYEHACKYLDDAVKSQDDITPEKAEIAKQNHLKSLLESTESYKVNLEAITSITDVKQEIDALKKVGKLVVTIKPDNKDLILIVGRAIKAYETKLAELDAEARGYQGELSALSK